ncbi:hypothetical protein ACIHCQ_17615 [Streptomyces sp. NPDC052236]|uniref:hypothetical protein n=1 Tax=Streptomyces sp. NPDC052236 TaxID=3365686 RepID=UPI0037CDB1A3
MRPRLTAGAARAALAWCAVLALGLGLAAAPPAAAADYPPEGYFALYAPFKHEVARAGAVPNDARFKDVQVEVVNARTAFDLVKDVELVIDTTGVKDIAEFRFAANCAVAGTIVTCPVGDIKRVVNEESLVMYAYKVRAKAGAANGATGQITYTARSSNTSLWTEGNYKTAVTVTEGADLVLTPPAQSRFRVPAGGSVPVPLEVSNAGSQTVPRTYLLIKSYDGGAERAELLGSYTNCWYRLRDSKDPQSAKTSAVCLLDTPLPADSARHVLSPTVRVGMGNYEESSALQFKVLTTDLKPPGVRGTSGVLKLVPKKQPKAAQAAPPPLELDHRDNSAIIGFDTGQVSDPAAAGATVKTRVGERFTAVVGVTNKGRAAYRGPQAVVMVEIPRGLKVLRFDKRCKATPNDTQWENFRDPSFGNGPEDDASVPTGALYLCRVRGPLLPDIKPMLGFTLTATRTLDKARGVVFVMDGRLSPGRNNLDFLTVTATPAAAGGSAGGGTGQTTGGSGTTGGTAGGTAGGTSGGKSGMSTGGSGGSGDLADTGSGSTVPVALTSIGAVGLGLIVFVVARRLRRRS